MRDTLYGLLLLLCVPAGFTQGQAIKNNFAVIHSYDPEAAAALPESLDIHPSPKGESLRYPGEALVNSNSEKI